MPLGVINVQSVPSLAS